jgi:hypothetical protein
VEVGAAAIASLLRHASNYLQRNPSFSAVQFELSGRQEAVISAILDGLANGRFANPPTPNPADEAVAARHIQGMASLMAENRALYLDELLREEGRVYPSSETEMAEAPPCTRWGGLLVWSPCPTTPACAAFRRLAPPVWAHCEHIKLPAGRNDCICVRYDPRDWPWWVWLIIGIIAIGSLAMLGRLIAKYGYLLARFTPPVMA